MNRRKFLKTSCAACVSTASISGLLVSCSSTRYISGRLITDGLLLNKEEFITKEKGKDSFRSFLIVRNEALQFPICVYRFSDTEYSAVWMACSHQGAELQASGEYLQCPAHGSEFSNRGKVTNGPADQDLRIFPVTLNENNNE